MAAKSLRGRPRKLAEESLEEYDVWVKGENPIEAGQLQKLKKDINALSQLLRNTLSRTFKPPEFRKEKANRYLEKMRRKRDEARKSSAVALKSSAAGR